MLIIAKNKKAKFDYEIIKTMEAGIVLTGNEIKSIRNNKVSLQDTFAKISANNEVFLINMYIKGYDYAHFVSKSDERRSRKLLLHKKEILNLNQQIKQNNYTLVPLKIYLKNQYLKVELGLCKGRKTHDKRQVLKERDIKREMDKEIKKRIKY